MAEEQEPVTKKEGTFDKDLIRELAELLEETGLTEIEIEHEGKRVRVARTVTVGAGKDWGLSLATPWDVGVQRRLLESRLALQSYPPI